MAALSVLSMERDASRAEVIGQVDGDNASWLLGLMRELEGDVTLDCRHSTFEDPNALMVRVEFEEFLRARGNRLTIDGVPDGPAAAHPSVVGHV